MTPFIDPVTADLRFLSVILIEEPVNYLLAVKKIMKLPYLFTTAISFLALAVFGTPLYCEGLSNKVVSRSEAEILHALELQYSQMPEQEIAISRDNQVYAQYAKPVGRYSHGILGDTLEAGQLVVVQNNIFYEITLEDPYVFEDIRPRLYDVDNDNELEFITIRTHIDKGAGIAVYKVHNNTLIEYAFVEEIGAPYRWLNIAAVVDLDNDGIVELAWIQTPHIGGTLKVAKFHQGQLSILDQTSFYSNHAMGKKNLCLSVIAIENGRKLLYVPGQDRMKIVGFSLVNSRLDVYREIALNVDFSRKLEDQYDFSDVAREEDNCISSK